MVGTLGAAARAVVLHQEPASSCLEGELCLDQPDTTTGGPADNRPVADPAGKVVRSLITMGFVVIVLVAYFTVAFGGSLPFRRKARHT